MAGWRSVDEQRAYLAPRLRRWYPAFITGGQYYARTLLTSPKPEMVVLDAGAGEGGYIHLLKGRVKKIIGVDQHADFLQRNTIVDEKITADLKNLPLPDTSVDLITAEFVLEHLAEPTAVFKEWRRVLKPGGQILILTPNIFNPIMLLSRITPTWVHRGLKRRLLKKSEHVHPTYYRANTAQTIARLSHEAGLTVRTVIRAGNPEYLAINRWLAVPAILLERLVSLPRLGWIRMYMVISLEKQG